MTVGRLVLVSLLISLSWATFGQKKTKAQLQREKQQSLEKIKEVEKILEETTSKKSTSLGELSALNQRIVEQEKLIESIKKEIDFLSGEISENNDIIQALEEDLRKMKKEYAAMLFAAQKANNSATRLTFLFSATTFEQMMMRLRYMDQYSATRKLQVEMIRKVQEELGAQVRQIEGQKTEKSQLLADGMAEGENLEELKRKQNQLVKRLEKEEKKLRKDLEATKVSMAKLEKLIDEIIREEIEREAALAKANVSTSTVALSASFAENKHKLPWPVSSGFISQKFGIQDHPVLKGIVMRNLGVNIQTKQDEKVKCVFEGEVSMVSFIPGIGSTVVVKHGEYFTIYAGLKVVDVREGQKVLLDQEIGRVISNTEGVSELRFQIFKNTQPLDPQGWLRNL